MLALVTVEVLVVVAMFTVTWLKSGKWWVWWYIGLNRDASNYKRAMQLNARGNAMDGNIERRGGNTVTWLPSTATHRLARHQQLWLKLSKIAKLWFPPPAPPHLVSGIFWRILICQTLSFVTNFGNLTEQWNMCAKCNEHKYGLFSGVSVAPAAILSKVNFLTGSQVFYSCCTTPLIFVVLLLPFSSTWSYLLFHHLWQELFMETFKRRNSVKIESSRLNPHF